MTNADIIRKKWVESNTLPIHKSTIKSLSDEVVAGIIQRQDTGCMEKWCCMCKNKESCKIKRVEILKYLKQEVEEDGQSENPAIT